MSFLTEISTRLHLTSQADYYYFRNWEYRLSEAQRPLTITLGLILLFSIGYLSYFLYRKWFARKTDIFSTTDSARIFAIFEQAVAERATHEIQFHGEAGQRTIFFCSPVGLESPRTIVLEVSGFIHPQESWVGRRVQCHFKLIADKNKQKWSFYHFFSTITGIRQERGLEFILVNLPGQLESKQRRQHLRLDPPSEDVPLLDIWPETLGNLDHPDKTPPMLSFIHGRQDNPMNVLNVSGGGLLLEVRPSAQDIPKNALDKGQRVFLNMGLRDPEQGRITEYLLLAQIRNVFIDPVTGNRLVGLSFTALQAEDGNEEENRWTALHGKGVEEIEDWVFKRHLQLYRKKGIV
jgi:hypothetical protein